MKIVFPVSNGVVVHYGDKKVVSFVNCCGQRKMNSSRDRNKIVFWHFPFIRGLQFFFCGIFAFLQALICSIDLCGNEKQKIKNLNKYYMKKLICFGAVAVFATLFSAFVLGYVPGKIGYQIVGYSGSFFLRNVVICAFKIVLFCLFVLCLRFFSVVAEMFRFNKASIVILRNERKGLKKKVKVTDKSVNFLNYIIFVFILDFVVVTLWGASFGFWFNLALNFAVLLASISVGFEVLNLIENSKFMWVSMLAYLTKWLVCSKPTRTHFETVTIALTELNLLCNQKGREFMEDESKKAFSVVYTQVRNKLLGAGVNDKSDADWIIATVLGKNRAEIKLVPFVTDKQYDEIMKATERRAKGESIDNIFGYTEFFGLRFDVNKKVLTPRMETEILVEQVLKAEKDFKNATILDIGTGSGAIAISVAKNCDAKVTAVDISKMALATAESNAKKNDVKIEFLHSNLFENLKRKRKFDIIVSNPPYIPTKDIPNLDKNVKECDPVLALDGGEDGLDFYRTIISDSTSKLNANGMIFFEVGKGEASAVKKLLKENGFEEIKIIKDYNKIERVICGKYK